MSAYDQILASAYYVFGDQLNSLIIQQFITLLTKGGIKLPSDEMKIKELNQYIEFDNHKYKLKNGCTIEDISSFINFDMVTIFHNIKRHRDKYYSKTTSYTKKKM